MRHAFTLIELLVVIVIILILLGIAAGVGSWAVRSSEEALTKTSLVNAQLIFDEFTNTIGVAPTGWPAGTGGTSTLVAGTKNLTTFKKYYASLSPKLVDLASNRLNDGWGNALQYVPANNAYNGNPSRPSPYFMSGGPDGNSATPADNVYSFAVIQ